MFRAGGEAWRSYCLWGLPSRVVIVEVKGEEVAGEVGPAESLKHPPTHTHIQEPELHPGGGGREGF